MVMMLDSAAKVNKFADKKTKAAKDLLSYRFRMSNTVSNYRPFPYLFATN
jgi:hypothetical protein